MNAKKLTYLLLLIILLPAELLGLILFIFVYAIKRFLSRKNRGIIFISHQEDLPADNDDTNCFIYLKQTFAAHGYEIIPKMKRVPQRRRLSFIVTFISQAMATAKAAVVITDGYSIPAAYLSALPFLRNTLTSIQIWHAIGAIKRFNGEGFEKHLLGAHRGYTHVLAPSGKTADFYAEAFGTEICKVKIIGTPLLDILYARKFDKRDEILDALPEVATAIRRGKKIVLYVPTYRDKNINAELSVKDAARNLGNVLNSETFYLLPKLHPIDAEGDADLASGFKAEELLYIADAVVTDYSGLAINAALLDKPLFFYLYDIEEYLRSTGLNIDPESEYKNYAARGAAELANIMQKAFDDEYDAEYEKIFADKYIETYDGKCTERLAELILSCPLKTES
jgi:CDP-ribitol ribitolphosphotransferase